jgi:hypothetical protein
MSTDDLKVGDTVVTWTGGESDEPGRELTVVRVTKTQLVTSDDTHWSRQWLTRIGDRSLRARRLYRVDDPRIAAAAQSRQDRAERAELELGLRTAAYYWVQRPDEDNTAKLRTAVVAVAPHLGLAVTVDADQCTYTDGDRPCLLPADHIVSGQWHAGLGWTGSLTVRPRPGRPFGDLHCNWCTDAMNPDPAHHSPDNPEEHRRREALTPPDTTPES